MYYLTNLFNLKNSFIKHTKGSKGDPTRQWKCWYNDDTFMYNITTIPDVIFLFDEIFCNVASIQKPYA